MGLKKIRIFKLYFTPLCYNNKENLYKTTSSYLNYWYNRDSIGEWARENNIRIESVKIINKMTEDIELHFYMYLSSTEYEEYKKIYFLKILTED